MQGDLCLLCGSPGCTDPSGSLLDSRDCSLIYQTIRNTTIPFINLKIADISENNELNMRNICYTRENTHGVMHGNLAHRVGCHNCVKKIKKGFGRCPMCRRIIDKIVKII